MQSQTNQAQPMDVVKANPADEPDYKMGDLDNAFAHFTASNKRTHEQVSKTDPEEDPDATRVNINMFTGALLTIPEGYEESTEWSVSDDGAYPVLKGPDGIKRSGLTTLDLITHHFSTLDDAEFVGTFVKYLKDSGLAVKLENENVWTSNKFTLVKVGQNGVAKDDKSLTVAEKQAKQRREALTAFRKKDHVHGYANIKNHAAEFLAEYEAKLWPYQAWLDNKAVSFDYDGESARFTQASDVAVIEERLKYYLKSHKATELESLKGAFFIGRSVNFIRAKGSVTWTAVATRLGIGKSTLAGKEKLYRFLNDYPLFLRMAIPYTTLLRYSADLRKHFNACPSVGAEWKDLKRVTV